MPADKLRSVHSNQNSQKKRSRDADLLVLLWDLVRTRENEIDHLLDLAVCMLLAAPNFPEKTELDRTLQKARSLLRTSADLATQRAPNTEAARMSAVGETPTSSARY